MQLQGLDPDLIAWTAMMTAYNQLGHAREALLLFRKMDLQGLEPDRFAFVAAIDACSSIPSLEQGTVLHSRLLASSVECDGVVGNALLNFYAKAGLVHESRSLFSSMKVKNVVTWSAIVAAYAQNGHHEPAVELFREMLLDGIAPNKVTFVSLLFSCSHAGLVDESLYWLSSMLPDYSVKPLEQHCVCVIDILGRAGRLDEAQKLLSARSDFDSELIQLVSATLLGFCNVHGEFSRGAGIAEQVLELESEKGQAYISVSNFYATTKNPGE
ncbi:pentatricopeptide repeat-containing protein At4g02750-like [Selaginella moellendorffii]|uniref:pentatricopeptide repeat-containing protein At4g02750-like n=1 Tax=Selaginella moellendorffii TaxID=88036 RepID=UPI000D1C70FA|nr:pentatricopeptide repeat-containing protein At4g02750-like [Selaginella moellendorffii]|eukprot:XP_024531924.1 pentatricopeptide repeat-containing protein At4g02750-like [Selaginella moellendorffii]